MARLLPRIWEIMCEINRRWCDYLVSQLGAGEKIGRNLIIRDGQVHMANMCLAACFKVNGVSRLHGDIIKNDLFRDVASFRRERFTYVTNGIDHRRWLGQINPGLHSLLCELLGSDAYLTDSSQLARLVQYVDDETVRQKMLAIKAENKKRFAAFAQRNDHVTLNTDAIMDVQIKRLHEYKRQLLCAMHIAKLQLQLHADPNRPFVPRTYVFGAKAAAGYKTAKRIIELLLSMQDDINNDPFCKDKLQIYFVENYRVSAAEAIVPAAQVSEQISTAGKEASGTGCMKLMMNGAVTIGTLDGANVEMFEQLGPALPGVLPDITPSRSPAMIRNSAACLTASPTVSVTASPIPTLFPAFSMVVTRTCSLRTSVLIPTRKISSMPASRIPPSSAVFLS